MVNRDEMRRQADDLTQAIYSEFLDRLDEVLVSYDKENKQALDQAKCHQAFGVSIAYIFSTTVAFALALLVTVVVLRPWEMAEQLMSYVSFL
ncbi:hypothetical protein SH528x_002162 [Novipirellula sp. SH528]|uniref:hypothetical protein n=1 Tax=Novipirellula sp. SH528 TaxID=3454466 RepID=UPI003F9F4A90